MFLNYSSEYFSSVVSIGASNSENSSKTSDSETDSIVSMLLLLLEDILDIYVF